MQMYFYANIHVTDFQVALLHAESVQIPIRSIEALHTCHVAVIFFLHGI